MRVRHFPTLERMREVYRLPRDPERFHAYLAAVEGERPLLPLSAYNPMAKEHVVERIEQLLALDAERVAAEAAVAAAKCLPVVDADLWTGLALADDVAGGWTNRWLMSGPRLGDRMNARRDGSGHLSGELGQWAVGLLWASDEPSPAGIRQSIAAALYRWAHDERYGAPRSLEEFMAREGRVHLFAGIRGPALRPDDLAYTRDVLASIRDTSDQPTAFAAWWGDEIAASVGYRSLGLSRNAGYALAVTEATGDPVAVLGAGETHMNDDLRQVYGWVKGSRERVFDWAETLPQGVYTQERPDFAYRSLRNIQAHIADCYLLWVGERGLRMDVYRKRRDAVMPPDVSAMRTIFHAVDEVLEAAFERFTDLDSPLELSDRPHDSLRVTRRWLLLHPITHEFHHKGQMLALGRVLGHPYPPGPDTDLLLPFEV